MHNITLYGEIKKSALIDALSDCPNKYHKIFSEEHPNFYGLVREAENPEEAYTIIIHNDTDAKVMPEIQKARLSVRGPDPEKVNQISRKLQEKIGFEISRESMNVFDSDNEFMSLQHEALYAGYKGASIGFEKFNQMYLDFQKQRAQK